MEFENRRVQERDMPPDWDRPKVLRYFVWVVLLSCIVEGVAIWAFYREDLAFTQLSMMLLMYIPLLSTLLCGRGLKGMGWKPRLRGKVRYVLLAWFGPALLSLAGGALYYGVFRSHFDLSGAILGETLMQNLTDQGISYPTYVVVSLIAAITYAPFINLFLGVGEEVGWRGFLYPQLKAHLGKGKGRLLGGLIWGLWHSPLIAFTGYEYGAKYPLFPVSGILLFCVFCWAGGVLLDELYEKTQCIWVPALFHGAINAAGTLGLAVLAPGFDEFRLLGPAPNGLLAGLPLFAVAWLVSKRGKKEVF